MTSLEVNRRFTLVRRPSGTPSSADFALLEQPLPDLPAGGVLVRNIYASMDPAMRGWLDDTPSYMPPVTLGEAVRAMTIGRVLRTDNPAFTEDQWVAGMHAVEDVTAVAPGGYTMPIDPDAVPSVTNYLSVLGGVGLTAYLGLTKVGQAIAGDTVLISGAAGGVGAFAGQIARIMGCRTIGIAGGAEKCHRLTNDYGFDAAIDYRGKDVAEIAREIAAAAPHGVDVIFENVGGPGLDAALLNLKHGARIALCGLISEYNSDPVGAANLWQVIVKSATIRGFLVTDFANDFADARAALARWLAEGKLRVDEHIEEGIDNALPVFLRLFSGDTKGKLILKL